MIVVHDVTSVDVKRQRVTSYCYFKIGRQMLVVERYR